VYVDILLTGSDSAGLVEIKEYLRRHFVIKDMGKPKYFLRIEVSHKKYSVLFSQWKYALDLLSSGGGKTFRVQTSQYSNRSQYGLVV